MQINTHDYEHYRSLGFEGFIKLSDVERLSNLIPNVAGIFIIFDFDGSGEFLEIGTGAIFKGRNPNKSIDKLKELWINDTTVLLIDKASQRFKNQGLRKKIIRLIRFGRGFPTGNFYNGRSLTQRSNFLNLTVAWLPLNRDEVKNKYKELLTSFIFKHLTTPFATSELRQIKVKYQERITFLDGKSYDHSFYYRVDILPSIVDDEYGIFNIDKDGYMLPINWNGELPENVLRKRNRTKNQLPLIKKINGRDVLIKPLDIDRWMKEPNLCDYRESNNPTLLNCENELDWG